MFEKRQKVYNGYDAWWLLSDSEQVAASPHLDHALKDLINCFTESPVANISFSTIFIFD